MTAVVGSFIVKAPNPVLTCSWIARANQYRGTTHTHTTGSDGDGTAAEMSAAYQALGHSFLAITDHNLVTADPGVSGMLHINGAEMGTTSAPYTPNHVVGLNLTTAPEVSTTTQDNIDAINAQANTLCVLAHPDYDAETQSLTGITHLELDPLVTHAEAGPFTLWDYYWRAGLSIWGLKSDDAHHKVYVDGATTLTLECNGALVVNADACTSSAILAAIRDGNFYATTGTSNGTKPTCLITSISVADSAISVAFPQSTNVYWSDEDGTVIRTMLGVTSDKYQCRGDEGHVRIKAVNAADTTRKAYGQPIRVTP